MNALTLQWLDAGQYQTRKIQDQQPSKNPGTIRIGRDSQRCDIVLSNPTVSGLHVEIFFNQQQQQFFIRNLRSQNPPLIDGQQLFNGERPLNEGSTIYLGQMELRVIAVEGGSVPATVLAPPQPGQYQRQSTPPPQPANYQRQSTPPAQAANYQQQPTPAVQVQHAQFQHKQTPPAQQYRPPNPPAHHHHHAPSPQGGYGLECPKCRRVSSIEFLNVGCPWCGTSLAAAASVLVPPGS